MHHDYLLVLTHLGSNITTLDNSLNAHPEIAVNASNFIYSSPLDLRMLRSECAKKKEARIYVDHCFVNHALRTNSLYDTCKFIYFLGEPIMSITRIIKSHNYAPNEALKHYAFRLQRMLAGAKQTTSAVLVTYKTLENDTLGERLAEYLHLKSPLKIVEPETPEALPPIEKEAAEKVQAIYDRYLERFEEVFATDSIA